MKYAYPALLLLPTLVVALLLTGCDLQEPEASFGSDRQVDIAFPATLDIPEINKQMYLSFGGDMMYETDGDETFWIYERFADYDRWDFAATEHTEFAALGRPDDYEFRTEMAITDSSAFADRRGRAILVRVNRVWLARPSSHPDRIVAVKVANIAATDTTSAGRPTGHKARLLYSVAN